ncbi:hypothetical protein [Nonomuraea sp. NPDC049480]|uniref:hypothetical protein n=1 Tax=Nonomuraea sp. NPDC049480 TaxID=3364353 RepID=UPI00378AFFA7
MTISEATPTSRPINRRPLSAGRIAVILIGILLAMSGLTTLGGAGVALVVDRQQDDDGFFTAGPGRFTTDTYAIAAPSLDFRTVPPDTLFGQEMLGKMRIQLDPLDHAKPLFAGIGSADEVAAYLSKVNHDDIGDLDFGPFGVSYTERQGGAPATVPAEQNFWVASDTGTGARTLTWQIVSGDWAAVIMNSDGSAGVRADLRAGMSVPAVSVAVTVTFVVGALVLLVGTGMVALSVAPQRRPRPRRMPQSGSEG